MKSQLLASLAGFVLLAGSLLAQVPQLINYQGRVAVNGINFNGSGQFKFALVNADGTTSYWSNTPDTAPADGVPDDAVTLTVTNGLCSVLLGDGTLPHMTIVPATVFTNPDVRLRVWFDDGTHGPQLLTPDQRIAAVGYAMMADNVKDGAITSAKLAVGAVGSAQLAANLTVTGTVTAGTIQGKGAVPWQEATAASVQAESNKGYFANSASQVTFTLPPAPAVGDVVRFSAVGAGGWALAQNANQSVLVASAASSMGGVTWTARNIHAPWHGVASSADGTKLVAVPSGKIYTSTDSGVTWTARESNRSWSCVASSADGTKLVTAVDGGLVYTSTDSGVSWAPRLGQIGNRNWVSVASSADGTKLVAAASSELIFTSTDSGATWTARANDRDWSCVASSADGTKLVAAVDGGLVYTSTDSGVSWTARGINSRWRSVASSTDGTKLVAVVRNGLIYTSADSGVTWTERESERDWSAVASAADGTKLVAAVDDGWLYTTTNVGVTWTARANDRHWSCVASSADGTKLVAADGDMVYTSAPPAATPSATTPGTAGCLIGSQGTAIELQYIGNNQFMPLSHEGTIFAY